MQTLFSLPSLCFPSVLLVAAVSGLLPCRSTAQQVCKAAGSTPRLIIVNKCSEDVWMMETPPGSTPPVRAQWNWFTEIDGVVKQPAPGILSGLRLAQGSQQQICVPDKGAPGGNFRFFMGCPNNNPYDPVGCALGSAIGDLAGINTLFEPTFGCRPTLSGTQCAFNPSSDASRYPDCAANPSSQTCGPLAPGDNFDISAVDGYTIPIRVDAQPLPGKTCNRLTTDAGMLDLASCPTEDDKTLYSDQPSVQALLPGGVSLLTTGSNNTTLRACVAPYKWLLTGAPGQTGTLGTPVNPVVVSGECNPANGTLTSACFYSGAGHDPSDPVHRSPGDSGPQQRVGPKGDGTLAIQNTRWVQDLYALGYGGYTWQYGDGIGDQGCDWGATITVTLCPRGGSPYRRKQLWAYSQEESTCVTNGSTGDADGQTTFSSLAECQRKKMRYTCDEVSKGEPSQTPTALWKADSQATRSGTGSTYQEVQSLRRLVCSEATYDNIKIPTCNYVYTNNDSQACPLPGLGSTPPLSGIAVQAATGARNGTLLPVFLTVTNNGSVPITAVTLNQVSLRTLAGAGEATLDSVELPIPVGTLAPGDSRVVALQIQTSPTTQKLALSESGTFQDAGGATYRFSPGQVLFP